MPWTAIDHVRLVACLDWPSERERRDESNCIRVVPSCRSLVFPPRFLFQMTILNAYFEHLQSHAALFPLHTKETFGSGAEASLRFKKGLSVVMDDLLNIASITRDNDRMRRALS